MDSAVLFTVPHCATSDKTNTLPQELCSLNGSLPLDEKPHRVKKKKKEYLVVLTNRRCCLFAVYCSGFTMPDLHAGWKNEHLEHFTVSIFQREREVYSPQQQHLLLHLGCS